MVAKLVTLRTFQPRRSWLSADVLWNARSIELTLATFQLEMSSLNAALLLNTSIRVVTADVSQLPIGP